MITLTAEDMQKKKNDVKARTTLLLSLLNEHQLRFSQLQFMDIEIEQDDLNQKFLTSLAPKWLMHTIVWRNRSDLDTMSLDDLYNHLKVYESEVQKKSETNSQNMAFISSAKHSSGNKDDGVGWDWSYMANDEEDHALIADEVAPTEFALMANTSAESKVFDNSLFSKDCKKNNDSLNSKITDLTDKLFDANNLIYHYKLALAQVESRLVKYKEREVKYYEKIKTLEFHNESHNKCIEILKKKLETLKEETEGVDGKLAGLLKASKDLNNLIESHRPSPTLESTSGDDQNKNPSVSETVASPITPKPFLKFVKPKDSQSKSKTGKTESPKKPPVKYAKQYRKPNKKPNFRGNQRNWNNLKSHQLGPNFVIKKKACFNCGDFNHLAYDCGKRVRKSFTPKPVAHRPYRPSQRPAKTNMNGARQNITSFNKQAHSYANRPFHRTSPVRSPYRAPWVLTVYRNFPPVNTKFSTGSRNFPTTNRKFPTASRKFLTGSTKCSTADMRMKGKAGSSHNNIDDKGYWESGCSRHMTGNISYLSDYEPFDGGYVSFGQGGCKIAAKRTIKPVNFLDRCKLRLFRP
nr:ribonuclease H-like domain-containing protein [Tanacetum cinerariifolium]